MGFAADPTVVVKVYVLEKFKTIYVQKESFGYGVPNNELGGLIMSVVDNENDLVIADSSDSARLIICNRKASTFKLLSKGQVQSRPVSTGCKATSRYQPALSPADR